MKEELNYAKVRHITSDVFNEILLRGEVTATSGNELSLQLSVLESKEPKETLYIVKCGFEKALWEYGQDGDR